MTAGKDQPNFSDADRPQPFLPLAGLASDGYSKEGDATATCLCGTVQLSFPTEEPGLANTFLCHCTDCHKITASMFASNFVVWDSHLKHLRGRDNLTAFGQSHTIGSKELMTNYFCKTCGTLMYRIGARWPDRSILRIGTVDDFNLMETKLKPRVEYFVEDRVSWLSEVAGAEHVVGMGS